MRSREWQLSKAAHKVSLHTTLKTHLQDTLKKTDFFCNGFISPLGVDIVILYPRGCWQGWPQDP